MFLIEDGREQFYQWDSNRRLIIQDGSITQVHFCNRTDNCSLVVEVYIEGDKFYADVPNILLQTDWDIRVYAFDSNYTKFCKTYNVNARTKPADYVYTETEVLNYESLEAQINAVKEDIGAEVEAYMKENPVEVDLTGMATEQYVQEQIANIDIPEGEIVDEVYVGATHPNDANVKLWVNPDETLDFATTGYVDEAIANIEIPDTTGLATEKYVDDAIANIDIPEGDGGTESYTFIHSATITDEDKAFLEEYWQYYLTNGEVKPMTLYRADMMNSGTVQRCYEIVDIEANAPSKYLTLLALTPSNDRVGYTYYFNNDGTYKSREHSSISPNNSKDWHWYSCYGETSIPVGNVGTTNHIKIVLTANFDSAVIYTYDISTSYSNSFSEEWQTKYSIINPCIVPKNADSNTMYFVNDGGTLRLLDNYDNDMLEFGMFMLQGFYYWQ